MGGRAYARSWSICTAQFGNRHPHAVFVWYAVELPFPASDGAGGDTPAHGSGEAPGSWQGHLAVAPQRGFQPDARGVGSWGAAAFDEHLPVAAADVPRTTGAPFSGGACASGPCSLPSAGAGRGGGGGASATIASAGAARPCGASSPRCGAVTLEPSRCVAGPDSSHNAGSRGGAAPSWHAAAPQRGRERGHGQHAGCRQPRAAASGESSTIVRHAFTAARRPSRRHGAKVACCSCLL
mmetsp:Transcript_57761/g.161097  ORF Transcript_57761/g.161097 Transcript_57761/m.161097 type:complete len:238 (-) Transcript_57761:237-950(-)